MTGKAIFDKVRMAEFSCLGKMMDVYLLSNNQYYLDVKQLAKLVKGSEKSLKIVLNDMPECLESLTPVVNFEAIKVEGDVIKTTTVTAVVVELAVSYWQLEAFSGNQLALKLVMSIVSEHVKDYFKKGFAESIKAKANFADNN